MSDYSDDVFESDIPAGQAEGDHANHHYRVSVDLRSIGGLKQVASVFVCYEYPAHPPVKVQQGSECLLPDSFCSFEFALTRADLIKTMAEEPLILEVVHRDEHQKDIELGIVKILLSDLLAAPAHKSEEKEAPFSMQVIDAYYNVYHLTTEEQISAVGTLRVVTMLEDFGCVAKGSQRQPTSNNYSSSSSSSSSQPVPRPSFVPDRLATNDRNYKQQFEEWKADWARREEAKLEQRWQIEESRRMQVLEREWKKHVLQIEMKNARKQKELGKLEKRVKETMFDLEKQDRRLKLRIEDHKAKEKQLRQEHERDQKDTAMVVKRLKEHFKHQLHLKQKRCDEAARESEKAHAETGSTLEQYEELLKEYRHFKIKTSKSQNGMLRLELVGKENEVLALKKVVAEHTQEQEQMKQALKMALREVSRINKLRQKEANARLEAERADLQRLRMQYLAKQQQDSARRDTMELQSIKSDLRSLITGSQKPQGHLRRPQLHTQSQPQSPPPAWDTGMGSSMRASDDIITTRQGTSGMPSQASVDPTAV
jgi:hypothetical protein